MIEDSRSTVTFATERAERRRDKGREQSRSSRDSGPLHNLAANDPVMRARDLWIDEKRKGAGRREGKER